MPFDWWMDPSNQSLPIPYPPSLALPFFTPTSQTSQLALPAWIGEDQKVTLELDGKHQFGKLHLKE
eukprot:10965614-Ditylum_brightwellii.AAC.1